MFVGLTILLIKSVKGISKLNRHRYVSAVIEGGI
jgi:hypothetical protein